MGNGFDELRKLKEYTEKEGWHSPWSLIMTTAVITGGYLFANTYLWRYFSTQIRVLGLLGLLLIWISLWSYHRFHLNRSAKGKIGIVVAIHAENKEEESRLKKDFIDRLNKTVSEPRYRKMFDVMIVKNHQCKKFQDLDWLKRNKRKIGGVLYLIGEVKKRLDGSPKYFISLEGAVMHKPIPQHASNTLAFDFLTVLPRRVSFTEEFQFREYELTADRCAFAAVYMVGCAAFVSGAPRIALELHESIESTRHWLEGTPTIRKMRERLRAYMFDERMVIAQEEYRAGNHASSRSWCEKAMQNASDPYAPHLLLAILDFHEKGAEAALVRVLKAKRASRDRVEWLFSHIFLNLWLENYPVAISGIAKLKTYDIKRALRTSEEVKGFVLAVLKEAENKSQFYYWLGFLEYTFLQNHKEAKRHFERFLESPTENMGSLVSDAKTKLIKIDKA